VLRYRTACDFLLDIKSRWYQR